MSATGGTSRRFLLLGTGAAALFLAGLVMSHFVWNRLETDTAMPCGGADLRWQQTEENIAHAAALLSRQEPELSITPAHLFQFPFDYLCVVHHGESEDEILSRIGVPWPCASAWAREIVANDTYLSLLAVAGDDVVAVRLNRALYDVAEDIPARIGPHAPLLLRKRPGSDQVLLRFSRP